MYKNRENVSQKSNMITYNRSNFIIGYKLEMKKIEENRRKKKELNRKPDLSLATLDHLVASYDLHGSYFGPILKPPAQRDIYIYIKFKEDPQQAELKTLNHLGVTRTIMAEKHWKVDVKRK